MPGGQWVPPFQDGYYGGSLDQVTVTGSKSTAQSATQQSSSKRGSGNRAEWGKAIFGNLGNILTGAAGVITAAKSNNNNQNQDTGGFLDGFRAGSDTGKTNYAGFAMIGIGAILLIGLLFAGFKAKSK